MLGISPYGIASLVFALFGFSPSQEVQLRSPEIQFENAPSFTFSDDLIDLLTFADVDRDGNLDVVYSQEDSTTVRVRLGDGTARFTTSFSRVSRVDFPGKKMFAADFDGDDNPDVAVVEQSGRKIGIARFFLGPLEYVHPRNVRDAAAADFNLDGFDDFAVLDNRELQFVHWDPDDLVTHFESVQTIDLSQFEEVKQVVTGDFNGDGRPDVAVTGIICDLGVEKAAIHVVFVRSGGEYLSLTYFSAADLLSSDPGALVVLDVNGNGRDDLAASFGGTLLAVYDGNLINGGSLNERAVYDLGEKPEKLRGGDYDGDGRSDLFALKSNEITVHLSESGFQFGSPTSFPTRGDDLFVDDINADGHVDALVLARPSHVTPHLGDGGVSQLTHTRSIRDQGILAPRDMSNGDFNEDGNQDLVVLGSSGIHMLFGDGGGGFAVGSGIPDGSAFILVEDFNRDNHLDVVTSNPDAGAPRGRYYRGDGAGSFALISSFDAGEDAASGDFGDFNEDGILDLVFGHSDGHLSLLFGVGDGSFGSPVSVLLPIPTDPIGSQFMLVDAADVEEDKRTEIVVVSEGLRSADIAPELYLLRGDGSGSFTPELIHTYAGWGPTCLQVTRMGSGAFPDIGVSFDDSTHALFRIRGPGFSSIQTFLSDTAGECFGAADVNGDSRPDLIVAHDEAVTFIRGTTFCGGPSTLGERLMVGPKAAKILPVDLDGNGELDLVICSESESEITIHVNSSAFGAVFAGRVALAEGPAEPVLKFNGSQGFGPDRRRRLRLDEPLTMTLESSSFGPSTSVPYFLWVWVGGAISPTPLAMGVTPFGSTANPTPFDPLGTPQPVLCVRGSGTDPGVCTGIQEKPGPSFAPFSIVRASGIGRARQFVVQGMIADSSTPDEFVLTNAVFLDVRDN